MAFIPPPIRWDFLDKAGKVSAPWLQWFGQMLGPTVASALQTVTLQGDITGTGSDVVNTTISDGVVTPTKMAPIGAKSLIGNAGASPAIPQSLSGAQVVPLLPAGGDLSGYYDTPTVVGIQGKALATLAAGYVKFNGTSFIYESVPDNSAYNVAGLQVVGARQTGMGTQLSAYTLTGTYASDLANLQALYNKVVALEAALRTHGLVTT